MAEVQVRTSGGEYTVFIGHRLYEGELVGWLRRASPGKAVVVSHPSIWELHGRRVQEAIRGLPVSAAEPLRFLFPEGEGNKNLRNLEEGYRALLRGGVTREDVILALGGGVVGDLAGFLAASYLRGIRYLQLPTTLMAMVDSSIGGKVGVDLPGAKNAVGAFYQPQAVLSDVDVLRTLPEGELRSGLAEVAKYGFLYDGGLLQEIEGWPGGLPGEGEALGGLVARCARHKARVVEVDERDESGTRALLNYGHTFGHALESAAGYGALRHGEAVALGMIAAARASEICGLASGGLFALHCRVLRPILGGMELPPGLDLRRVLGDMQTVTKRGRELRFVLLEEPQAPRLVESLPAEVVERALRETWEELRGAGGCR